LLFHSCNRATVKHNRAQAQKARRRKVSGFFILGGITMSKLLITQGLPGQGVTQVIGGEIQGKGVAPAGGTNGGTILTPNGQNITPAANALVLIGKQNAGSKR
jgi:hypothetical protein